MSGGAAYEAKFQAWRDQRRGQESGTSSSGAAATADTSSTAIASPRVATTRADEVAKQHQELLQKQLAEAAVLRQRQHDEAEQLRKEEAERLRTAHVETERLRREEAERLKAVHEQADQQRKQQGERLRQVQEETEQQMRQEAERVRKVQEQLRQQTIGEVKQPQASATRTYPKMGFRSPSSSSSPVRLAPSSSTSLSPGFQEAPAAAPAIVARKKIVALGTTNPCKTRATVDTLATYAKFDPQSVETVSVAVDSGVRDQPLTMEGMCTQPSCCCCSRLQCVRDCSWR